MILNPNYVDEINSLGLTRIKINTPIISPAARPKSSLMVKLIAVENPVNDHKKGMINIHNLMRFTGNSSIPNEYIVLGQGKLNGRVSGNTWPNE